MGFPSGTTAAASPMQRRPQPLRVLRPRVVGSKPRLRLQRVFR